MSCLILSVCLLAGAGPGLTRGGLCPECGDPMPRSVLSDNPWPDSLDMRFVGNWPFGIPHAIATDTARALGFCASGAGVLVLDISEPGDPSLISDALRSRSLVEGLSYNCADSTLYLRTYHSGIESWDVADPRSPVHLASIDLSPNDFVVAGPLAFACDWLDLRVYDVSDPSHPVQLGLCDVCGDFVAVADTLALVGGPRGLYVVSVADPAQPEVVGRLDVFNTGDLVAEGDWIYSAGWGIEQDQTGIYCIDMSDPARPRLDHIEATSHRGMIYHSCGLLVLPYDGGLKVFDISTPGRPVFRGYRRDQCRTADLGFIGSHAFIASLGELHGFWVFDLSDPSDPVSIARYVTPASADAVSLAGSYGFLVDPSIGLRLLDLSDMTYPVEAGTLAVGDPSCGIAVMDTLAYVAAGREGLIVLDVSSPLEPVEVGRLSLAGWAYGVDLHDTLAFVAAHGRGLNIVNAADPAHPELIANWDTTCYVYAADVSGQHAFLAAGAGLHILDISDLTAPCHVGQFEYESYGASDVAVKGEYAWVSFLCGGCGAGGIGALDVSDPENPDSADAFWWGGPTDIDLHGDYLFVIGGSAGVFDVSNPLSLSLVAYYETPWTLGVEWRGLCVADNHLFCACATQGLHIYEATAIGIGEREGTPPPAGIRLLENPIHGDAIRLDISAHGVSDVCIYSSTGQLVVINRVAQRGENRIPTKGLAAGTYFLRADGTGSTSSLKVLLPD